MPRCGRLWQSVAGKSARILQQAAAITDRQRDSISPTPDYSCITGCTAASARAARRRTKGLENHPEFDRPRIGHARKLYAREGLGLHLANAVYALDSTPIDLCLSLFPWAPFRTTKATVKLHTLLALRGNNSSLVPVSDGGLHDVNVLDLMPA